MGSASKVMRTACPALILGASTSSMGARTYRQVSSIKSMAGGVGTPGGDGVEYSPTAPTILATVPAKGAYNTVRFCSTRVALTRAWVWATSALAASHPARRACASDRACSSREPDIKPCLNSEVCRSDSRSALAATVQASTTRLRAVSTWAIARLLWACWSSFHSFISNWPFLTLSPSLTASTSMRPPMVAESLVRMQASTVPARVLAMLDSTLPWSMVVTSTATGLGRLAHQMPAPSRPITKSASRRRRIRVDDMRRSRGVGIHPF